MSKFKYPTSSYVGLWTIVTFAGLVVRVLMLCGRVKLIGFQRVRETIRVGRRVMVAANHPSSLETWVIPVALAWPRCLVHPREFPWSVLKEGVFPRWLRWTYPLVHCTPVDFRNPKKSPSGFRAAYDILADGRVLVFYPEAGYTCDGRTFAEYADRRMQELATSAVPRMARRSNALILPIRIDFEGVAQRLTMLRALMWVMRGHSMTIHIGKAYRVAEEHSSDEADRELEQRILRAGAAED